MTTIATSWMFTHPSFVEPELIIQQNQASGAFRALAGGNPRVKIGTEDKYIYIRTITLRTKVVSNQAAGNQLPSAEVVLGTIQCPTYLARTRAEYDHHDTAMASEWGTNIVEAQRLAMRQGQFLHLRNMLLNGNLPANGEGLLNANGATTVNLPADSFGNTTARTYDNGQMAMFFLAQLLATKTRTMLLGRPVRFVILGPQRTLGLFEYPNIVQLTSYQRPGAGAATTVGVIKDIANLNGDVIEWTYDDTLQNQSASGVDTILIVMPEIENPEEVNGEISTNEFAKLTPGFKPCTIMYMDMAAPKEIPTPLPGGAIDILSELRASPGWAPRPEGITIVHMTY